MTIDKSCNGHTTRHDFKPRIDPEEDEKLCGIGRFRPDFLQVFARIGAFVGIYSVSGLLTSTLTVYVNSQVSMLEKQFGFSSGETGILMSCNDIGYLCCVIFAGYIARKVHIPRGLGFTTILYGICGIMCAAPFFLQDSSMFDSDFSDSETNTTSNFARRAIPMCMTNNSTQDLEGSCYEGNSAETRYNLEKLWIKKMAFSLIAIGMVLQGIGKSPRYPFVTLYIDDTVEKRETGFYMGVLSAIGIFGPALAYLLGGLFSKVYVTLQPVDITPKDPRWIGAWWLGFLVFGAASLISAFPLLCFPRRLRSKKETPVEEDNQTLIESHTESNAFIREIKDMMLSVVRVISNPIFTITTLTTCCNMVGIAGTISFMPKYLASQYSVPLWKANILMAASSLLAASIGSFSGGIISRRVSMTPQTTLKMLSIFYLINFVFFSSGLFVGCNQPALIGSGEDVQGEISTCSSDCSCNDKHYFPICGDDGQSYFSPCHAGCIEQEKMTFVNCSCTSTGQATPGLCEQGCSSKMYIFAAFNFVASIFGAMKIVPLLIVKLRCVEEKDRAVSTALAGFLMSALGWMPGPVIFGLLIDGTCSLWKYTCGERQSCLLYDIVSFRKGIHFFGMVSRGCAFLPILGLYIYFRVTKREYWRNEKPHTKEIVVKFENKIENGEYKQIPTTDLKAYDYKQNLE